MRLPSQSSGVLRGTALHAHAKAKQEATVVPQLRSGGGGYGGIGGGVLGFWCEAGCYALWAACLSGCTGATAGWGAVACLAACDIALGKCYGSCRPAQIL